MRWGDSSFSVPVFDWEHNAEPDFFDVGCGAEDGEFGMSADKSSTWIEEVLEEGALETCLVPTPAATTPTNTTLTASPALPWVPRPPVLWTESSLPEMAGFSLRKAFVEVESLVMDVKLGVLPRAAPDFIRKLAAADGGLVHSVTAALTRSALTLRMWVRFFAIDMLSVGLSSEAGREEARASLAGTRFATVPDAELKTVFQQLLAPEKVLSVEEMTLVQSQGRCDPTSSITPHTGALLRLMLSDTLPEFTKYLSMKPVPGWLAAYEGEVCPTHLLDPEDPTKFLERAPLISSKCSMAFVFGQRISDPRLGGVIITSPQSFEVAFDHLL
jgi:hypothetical protein